MILSHKIIKVIVFGLVRIINVILIWWVDVSGKCSRPLNKWMKVQSLTLVNGVNARGSCLPLYGTSEQREISLTLSLDTRVGIYPWKTKKKNNKCHFFLKFFSLGHSFHLLPFLFLSLHLFSFFPKSIFGNKSLSPT